MPKPSLEDIEAMDDEKSLEAEEKLLEESDNSARPADGYQPPQDEDPGLQEVTD